jgi:hypothetical protein
VAVAGPGREPVGRVGVPPGPRDAGTSSAQPVVQAFPLRAKPVGDGLDPVHEPLKPITVDAPGARLAFHDRLAALT